MRQILWVAALAAVSGCSDGGTMAVMDLSAPSDGGGADQAMLMTTTIAAARSGNVMTPITVRAVVTAVRGSDPVDTKEWYIEDPAGGPNSGIGIYCNHTAMTKPCPMTVTAPMLHDLVEITGTLNTYKGKVELNPTAQTVLMSNATPPPIPMVSSAEVKAANTSMYRGVVVKLMANNLTVDSVTPMSLYDTKCTMGDGGYCTTCKPPTYAGFQVNDGAGNEILVENHFYTSETLQSSPECLSQAGVKPVTVGMHFSSMQGILEWDPNGSVQAVMPVLDSDYTTP